MQFSGRSTSRIRTLGFLCLFALVVSACETDNSGGVIQHPTEENIPDPSQLADVISMDDRPEPGTLLHRWAQQILSAEEVAVIGVQEGDRSEMFGEIADVTASDTGNVFVLDAQSKEVLIYAPDGSRKGKFGRAGAGPKEFQYPQALTLLADGRLVVAERNRRVKTFIRNDSAWTFAQSFDVDFGPEDMCLMDGTLYLQGINQDSSDATIIHSFDTAEGTPVQSFGLPYQSKNWLAVASLSDGLIACNEESETIVFMRELFPVIYGYAPDGELLWTSSLADYTPVPITQGTDGILYGRPTGEVDLTYSVVSGPGKFVLVQIFHFTPESRQTGERIIRTYIIDASSGRGAYIGTSVPPITYITEERLYSGVNFPFPQLRIFGFAE